MKFSISRDALLKPLNLVAGVVERRQTLPILSNVLMVLEGDQLSLTGTDLEVELVGRVALPSPVSAPGEVTVPARKLVDICKSLPEGSDIQFTVEDGKVTVRSGRSRFTLSTLPAREFPAVEEGVGTHRFTVKQGQLRRLIDRTAFAMAQQDVRYYLNGMLLELKAGRLRVVATDGHRLAMCTLPSPVPVDEDTQVILPRKGVLELSRLLLEEDQDIAVVLGSNHLRATTDGFTFTSKLVDGKFPDYERVLPRAADKIVLGSRLDLRQAFTRTAILSNEKYRGVRLKVAPEVIEIVANNPEQEQAEEQVSVDYQGDSVEIGFNVSYLLDVLGVLSGEQVKLSLSDPNSSALLEESEDGDSLYVVMPMRL
ncbi:DNA polymerase III subunit beta [Haliea sp.]|jgi:DNA polymerase-3 subunit beta|uniref:DNA polymerase III subunit beta n=1 Tax=Haliea TaxID=475794 RepID=UPI000C55C099|nr:DNA polymerase III subunit beta [Haliea sp.]HCD56049.1 DNA polymerase III subunit beta [Halieaceae bacterium]MAD65779.1 DNA polymerase III subunit beta [Haliea sp.]MAY91935.1 DNA polymerase III subunit beta [Haliea sp.]MBK41859.1 DNA polymerase III subunit beta [Haliea sp.]MBP70276.1 DNA polymerase III subunit beta [Haliea sp.]|tara:strand:- start:1399 stop:2505 length:1107 start_codon:yes stop_codon:yes gene_type:complete